MVYSMVSYMDNDIYKTIKYQKNKKRRTKNDYTGKN